MYIARKRKGSAFIPSVLPLGMPAMTKHHKTFPFRPYMSHAE
jgi:hypothetical protein